MDSLIQNVPSAVVPYSELNEIAQNIQESVKESEPMRDYAIRLWTALRDPKTLGVKEIDGLDVNKLVESGASPGMAMLIRAAKVNAWLGRLDLILRTYMGAQRLWRTDCTVSNYEFQHKEIVEKLLVVALKEFLLPSSMEETSDFQYKIYGSLKVLVPVLTRVLKGDRAWNLIGWFPCNNILTLAG